MKFIKSFLYSVFKTLYKIFAFLVPPRKDVILFESNLFRNCTGNPRYIYEEILRRELDIKYKCVWVFKNPDEQNTGDIPGNARIIKYRTLAFYYYFSAAAFIVSDSRLPKYLIKKPSTVYIQTWHGTPLKKLALDMTNLDMAGNTNIEKYHANFLLSTAKWDYLLSQNRFSTEIFKRCFDFSDRPVLEFGYPRNDILFCSDDDLISQIKDRLGLPKDKKIILYAPTWRDNQYYKKGEYKFTSAMDFNLMKEKLSGEYVFIVKYHYLMKDPIDWTRYDGFVRQCKETEDIASLYLVSDLLITDYSSVMFDYSILKRPMIFFTYDLDEYQDTLRGFYFDFLSEAPGPVVRDNDALIDAITHYDAARWEDKYNAFRKKYNHCDDGHASERVVELIQSLSR